MYGNLCRRHFLTSPRSTDNASGYTPSSVKSALEEAIRGEATESMVSILIGVGTEGWADVSDALKKFKARVKKFDPKPII